MKFLVVGHLCLDVIHPIDEPEVQSYGGIYYSVATLAALAGRGDRILPVFGVNKNEYDSLLRHIKEKFPAVDASGIYQFDEPTNNVHLFYQNAETRIECSKDISKPIPFEKIRSFLNVDGVLVNMISGFDLKLETLDELRLAVREEKVPIHFDYHSLTLGVKDNHERFRRPVSDWRRWAFMTDTIQLNEEEIGGLPLENLNEQQTIGHFLSLSVKGVVITRGERGATLYTSDHKKIVRQDIAGLSVQRARDATGCGDVFGAAFHFHYVKNGNMLAAAEFANTIAARKAQMVGAQNIELLGELPA
jgi:sugar/nucleoside kinase (ribokinase family)